jgi:hypothetical protein
MAHYYTLQKQEKLITQYLGGELKAELAEILAERYWRYGRLVLRQGHREAANQYFDKARKLVGRRYAFGSGLYKKMVQLFGPFFSEKALSILR